VPSFRDVDRMPFKSSDVVRAVEDDV
jgi:hypothetical protein